MALRDQPYMPIYVQDYLTDERLLMCSWSTQGIYTRILFSLHKQAVYGAILFKQTSKQNASTVEYFADILCKLIPCQRDEMMVAVDELIDNNVLLFDGEKLYQKRMYNDGLISAKRSLAAKSGGGNPALKHSKKKVKTDENLFKQNSKQNTENEIDIENVNEDIEEEGTGGEEKPRSKSDEILHDTFETFRRDYDGKKRGHDTELAVLKKHRDWREVVMRLPLILTEQKRWRGEAQRHGVFIPSWPNLQTWLNQRRWEEELNFNFDAQSDGKRTSNNQSRGNALDGDYLADLARRAGVSH